MSYAGRFITGSSTGPFVAKINNDGGTSAVPTLAGIWTLTGGITGLTFGGALNTTTLAGTLAIANGGTNATSMTNTYGVNYFDGTRIVTTTVGTAGQFLKSQGPGLPPIFDNASMIWNLVTVTAPTHQQMVSNNGYINKIVVTTTYDLPLTPTVGDVVRIAGNLSGQWIIDLTASETIIYNNTTALTSLASNDSSDSVELLCISTTGTAIWIVVSSVGSLILT